MINIEFTEQELQLVVNALAELPLKISLPLVQKIERLYGEYQKTLVKEEPVS